MNALRQEKLKECLHYDPETGVFTRVAAAPKHRRFIGKPAGYLDNHGYLRTRVGGRLYSNHRLAFLYMNGSFPPDEVDHIDGDRLNNCWKNLRPVTTGENRRNKAKYKDNKNPLTGAAWSEAHKRWRTYISVDGKWLHLGVFDTLLDAAAARKSAELKYGFHANHGRQ